MQVRDERDSDRAAVRALNESAFASAAEADLVDAPREQADPVISLVAEVRGKVVGHILFAPVSLAPLPEGRMMGLAPMAVRPGRQRTGTGSALVRAGLELCRGMGFGAVVVLGHSRYYPRFGFRSAAEFRIGCEYDVPEDVFRALELEPGYLRDAGGTVRYHAAFGNV